MRFGNILSTTFSPSADFVHRKMSNAARSIARRTLGYRFLPWHPLPSSASAGIVTKSNSPATGRRNRTLNPCPEFKGIVEIQTNNELHAAGLKFDIESTYGHQIGHPRRTLLPMGCLPHKHGEKWSLKILADTSNLSYRSPYR